MTSMPIADTINKRCFIRPAGDMTSTSAEGMSASWAMRVLRKQLFSTHVIQCRWVSKGQTRFRKRSEWGHIDDVLMAARTPVMGEVG